MLYLPREELRRLRGLEERARLPEPVRYELEAPPRRQEARGAAGAVRRVRAGALAVLVPGGGTYSRTISTSVPDAQTFFDQGLRFAWGFYFPESIASYQEAARLDPSHPMPYWGMAHAMGPNPNSRYGRMPDDPKGEGLKAISNIIESFRKKLINSILFIPKFQKIINSFFISYFVIV